MDTVESETLFFSSESNGTQLSPWEFDAAEFEPGWRYELVNGVLIVNPPPSISERDPNEELGRLLRNYQEYHPQGASMDATVSEQTVSIGPHRRRVDRAIWAGLGRLPRNNETPTIAVEFVSKGKRNRSRDYDLKRAEYETAGVQEYWSIDRFQHTLVAHRFEAGEVSQQTHSRQQIFTTRYLPGFELSLDALFVFADRWR